MPAQIQEKKRGKNEKEVAFLHFAIESLKKASSTERASIANFTRTKKAHVKGSKSLVRDIELTKLYSQVSPVKEMK
jgi:hypothetical protein